MKCCAAIKIKKPAVFSVKLLDEIKDAFINYDWPKETNGIDWKLEGWNVVPGQVFFSTYVRGVGEDIFAEYMDTKWKNDIMPKIKSAAVSLAVVVYVCTSIDYKFDAENPL